MGGPESHLRFYRIVGIVPPHCTCMPVLSIGKIRSGAKTNYDPQNSLMSSIK